ncbi:tetratricopeptide repeat protein [Ekhidna sp.]|uniref:tetratricopeptide repeat protein n=1 Tax=Ekhidna sp. TaxID=2608089 RepID=UPI003B50398D
MKNLLLILLISSFLFSHAQSESEDIYGDAFVPFGMLMRDVIDASGQDRLDAIDHIFEAIDNNTTEADLLSIPSVYFLKARELAYQGKHDEAFDIAKKIRKISPTIVSYLLPESRSWSFSLGYTTDGFVNWIKGDSELAKTYFDSANMYFSDGFYANYYMGWILQNEKNYEKALEYYTRAENGVSVIKFDWAQLYFKKGVIFHTMKLYNQAVDSYTKSIEKFPICRTFYERGKVYYFSASYQDKSLAYNDFQSIVENCPNYENLGMAYSYVAENYYAKQQNSKSAEYYRKAFELQGNFIDAGSASMVYYVMKDWNNTISWATKAINASRNVTNPNIRALGDFYFYRGYANWSLKRMDATVNDLQKARSYGNKTADQYLTQYFNK